MRKQESDLLGNNILYLNFIAFIEINDFAVMATLDYENVAKPWGLYSKICNTVVNRPTKSLQVNSAI